MAGSGVAEGDAASTPEASSAPVPTAGVPCASAVVMPLLAAGGSFTPFEPAPWLEDGMLTKDALRLEPVTLAALTPALKPARKK